MLNETLIIAPLEPELNPVIKRLKALGLCFEKFLSSGQVIYHCSEKSIILATSGLGKVEMALKVTELFHKYNFKQVLGIGSCGSLNSDLKLGSCWLIKNGTEHDFKTCLGGKNQYPKFESSVDFTHQIATTLTLDLISVASGDETINTSERAQYLRDLHPEAEIVTWETAGLARACKNLNLNWAEIRMVSDYCDLSNFAQFRVQVKNGMPAVADMIFKLL